MRHHPCGVRLKYSPAPTSTAFSSTLSTLTKPLWLLQPGGAATVQPKPFAKYAARHDAGKRPATGDATMALESRTS